MDYTQSPDAVTHGGTGHKMHSLAGAVTTEVTDKDLNSVIWSLMAILEAAGVAGAQFDPAVPATYTKVKTALDVLFLKRSGGQAMLGLFELFGDAVAPTQPTTLRQVQSLAAALAGACVGLKASSNGLDADITVSVESAVLRSAAGTYEVVRGFAATASTATTLDTGALAVNTWYAVYLVSDGTTPQLRCSLNFTNPALSGGYTKWAFVSAFRTDGSGNKYPLGFQQVGWKAAYRVNPASNVPQRPLMAAGVQGNIYTPTYVAVACPAFVPPNAGVISLVLDGLNSTTLAAPNANYGSYTSSNKAPLSYSLTSTATAGTSVMGELVLESSNIYYAADSAPGAMSCYGWEFNR